jgi:arginine deiminase
MSIRNEYGRLKKVLLCKPTYMKWEPITTVAKKNIASGRVFDTNTAIRQHEEFAETISSFGTEVIYSDPSPGLGVQPFTRDLGSATPEGILLGKFKYDVRKPEIDITKRVLINREIKIAGVIQNGVLEGGDIHFLDASTVVMGKAERTDDAGIDSAWEILGEDIEIIRVDVDKEFHHMDCVFIILGEKLCSACLEVLPREFIQILKERSFEIIEVSLDEARSVGSNMVNLDRDTILSHKGAESVNLRLKALGFNVLTPEIDMITGQGGGPRCLTFPLERE